MWNNCIRIIYDLGNNVHCDILTDNRTTALCKFRKDIVYNRKLKRNEERFIATGDNIALLTSPRITALNKIYVTEKHWQHIFYLN